MFVGESLADGKLREVLGLFWGLADWCEARDEWPVSPTSQEERKNKNKKERRKEREERAGAE